MMGEQHVLNIGQIHTSGVPDLIMFLTTVAW